ncbi:hypothetical protein EDD85DRAFT_809612 [Armillaria nabsnona]|nr:hypothetical protein EDD85DRAFT_809612 [Armillaria nabsnona]
MSFYMPASKASNDSMVALSSPDAERGVMHRKIKAMVFAAAFSTLRLLIRAIYRTIIELAGGLKGRIFFTEVYFDVLDGRWWCWLFTR